MGKDPVFVPGPDPHHINLLEEVQRPVFKSVPFPVATAWQTASVSQNGVKAEESKELVLPGEAAWENFTKPGGFEEREGGPWGPRSTQIKS